MLLLFNIALASRLEQAQSRKRGAQAARKAADAKLERTNSDANKVVELCKRQSASDVSVPELTVELKQVKAQLVRVNTEILEKSTKLDAVAVEPDKRLEEFAVVRGACNRAEGLVWSIVGQSAAALDKFVNQVGTQLVDRFRVGLEALYDGSQLSCLIL